MRKNAGRSSASARIFSVEIVLCPAPEQKDMLRLSFFNTVYSGMQSFFLQTGNISHSLMVWDSSWRGLCSLPPPFIDRLRKADAIMLIGDLAPASISELKDVQENIVALFCQEGEMLPVDSVVSDNLMAGMRAAQLLIDAGFKDIGFLASQAEISPHELRLEGAMLQTIRSLGYERFSYRRSASTDNRDIKTMVDGWLDSRTCPNAIVAPQPNAAKVFLESIKARGFACPDDFSIICFDQPNDPETRDLRFAHMDTMPRKLGIKGAQRLVQRLLTPYTEDSPHRIVVPCEFVSGDSIRGFRARIPENGKGGLRDVE
jgi:DNA-binding LacI/PurR family transcriptional regulator